MRTLMIVRILPMRIRSVIGVSIACLLIVSVTQAATFEIVFYQELNPSGNLFSDYEVVGAGTFEIADDAVTPGNLVLFEEADFLSFDVSIDTSLDTPRQYTLGIDDFPHSINNPFSQGILFDDNAPPLRFDTPATTAGNGASICDEVDCSQPNRLIARLTLFDDDDFNRGYVGDGTINSAYLF